MSKEEKMVQQSNVVESTTDFVLRKAELKLKYKEVANEKFIELIKIITTGIVIILIPAIISNNIKNQQVEIQRLKEELIYLTKFSEKVVEEDDLIRRSNYVEHLSKVAHLSELIMSKDEKIAQQSNVVESTTDFALRKAELELKYKEVANAKFIELIKIITTGIVVTLIPAIISNNIKNQQVEIQRLKEELIYLTKFSEKVVEEDDLIRRRNYVEYLSKVAHSSDSRDRWENYLSIINTSAQKLEKLDDEIDKNNLRLEELIYDLESTKNMQISVNQLSKEQEDSMKLELAKLHKELHILILKRKAIIERGKLTSPTPLSNPFNKISEHDIPEIALNLIKKFEGFRANAYLDPLGIPTIGYGTTRYPDGRKVILGDTVTESQATEYLVDYLNKNVVPNLESIPSWNKMNKNQQSALYSFAFNLGIDVRPLTG